MNHSAPSTILRRFIFFVSASALALGAALQVAAQQVPFPSPEMRRDPNATQATFEQPVPTNSPLGAPRQGSAPLQAPPPQELNLPAGANPTNAAQVAPLPAADAAPAVELTPRDGKTTKKLALPGSSRSGDASAARSGGISGVFSVLASLGVVLGLFFGAAYLMRRGMPKQGRVLPREAVESLGRIPFPGRQQGQLLRVGNKLVLVSFSNAGADVIAEITDPLEVDRLAGMCAQTDRFSSTKTFRDVVDQFFGEKPKRPEPPHRAAMQNAPSRSAASARFKEDDVA